MRNGMVILFFGDTWQVFGLLDVLAEISLQPDPAIPVAGFESLGENLAVRQFVFMLLLSDVGDPGPASPPWTSQTETSGDVGF